MVLTDGISSCGINGKSYGITYGKHTALHYTNMADFATLKLNSIGYGKYRTVLCNLSQIRNLTTHGCIERGLINDYGCILACNHFLYDFGLGGENGNLGSCACLIISDKGTGHSRIDFIVNRSVRTHIVGNRTGISSGLLLYFHRLLKAVHIYGKALFCKDFLGQVNREAVGIVKLKRIFAGKHLGLCRSLFHLGKNGKSLIDGLVKLLFL